MFSKLVWGIYIFVLPFVSSGNWLILSMVRSGTLQLLVLWLIAIGCGNPADQEAARKQLVDGLKDHKVTRVTQDQIHSAAYLEGQQIIDIITGKNQEIAAWNTPYGRQYLDSLNEARGHDGIELLSEATPSSAITENERALFEAYQYSTEQGQIPGDNVQRLQDEYLLYTFPIVEDSVFIGMWSLQLSKKTLIRNL